MELWLKLNNEDRTRTKTDNIIKKYVLLNIKKVPYMSIKELGAATETSDSAITRFCRKMGLSGFSEFKIELSKIIPNLQQDRYNFNVAISRHDEMYSIFEKTTDSCIQALEQSKKLMNIEALKEAVELLDKAKRVFVFASGNSQMLAIDLVYKFKKVNLNVIYSQEYHLQLLDCVYMKEGDVAFAISTSGRTREIVELLKLSKHKSAKTICISQASNPPSDKFSDIKLAIPYIENEFRESSIISRIIQLNMIDSLFIGLMSKRFESIQDGLKDAREFVEHTKIKG